MRNKRLLVPVSGAVSIGIAFGLYVWRRCVHANRPAGRLARLTSAPSDWAPHEAELLRSLHFLPR